MGVPKLPATALSILAAISSAVPASAQQPQTVTLSTRVNPEFVDGDLVGCQLSFEVARNDPEYSHGDLVYLTGNLGFAAFEGKELSFRLKLGAKRVTGQESFAPPSDAYLIDGYDSNARELVARVDGEHGFRMFLYSAEETTLNAAMRNVAQDQRFTFAYAMSPGGLSAIVPVDLRVEQLDLDAPDNSVVSDRTAREWVTCLRETASAARSRLEAMR